MSNIVYIAASIDGYIAKEDGNLDWLTDIPNPDNSDYGFSEFMNEIDAIIMGRKTFEVVLGFGEWSYTKPVYVLSNTLSQVPDRLKDKAEIIKGDLKEIIINLKKKGIKNLYIDGGNTIQNFLKLNLIDELIITRIPILLGSGIPLFSASASEFKLNHIKTEILSNSLVKSKYKVIY